MISAYHHPSNSNVQQKHQLGGDHRRNGSGTPASVEALEVSKEARISVFREEAMQALRLLNVSATKSSSTHLSEDATAAWEENYTQSVKDQPGSTLNPASCASGLDLLALLSSGWTTTPSLAARIEGMNSGQGVTLERNSSNQNEEWEDFHLPSGN